MIEVTSGSVKPSKYGYSLSSMTEQSAVCLELRRFRRTVFAEKFPVEASFCTPMSNKSRAFSWALQHESLDSSEKFEENRLKNDVKAPSSGILEACRRGSKLKTPFFEVYWMALDRSRPFNPFGWSPISSMLSAGFRSSLACSQTEGFLTEEVREKLRFFENSN